MRPPSLVLLLLLLPLLLQLTLQDGKSLLYFMALYVKEREPSPKQTSIPSLSFRLIIIMFNSFFCLIFFLVSWGLGRFDQLAALTRSVCDLSFVIAIKCWIYGGLEPWRVTRICHKFIYSFTARNCEWIRARCRRASSFGCHDAEHRLVAGLSWWACKSPYRELSDSNFYGLALRNRATLETAPPPLRNRATLETYPSNHQASICKQPLWKKIMGSVPWVGVIITSMNLHPDKVKQLHFFQHISMAASL